jgi:hypothetical protein
MSYFPSGTKSPHFRDAGADYYSGSGRARSRFSCRDRDDKYRARDMIPK